MRFCLIDRITELEVGKSITAVKNLTMAEEYLADHFPRFPVMPGVMMLQALAETASWLIRATDDFAHSMVTIAEANNVKYGRFVEPGQQLVISAEILGRDGCEVKIKANGRVNDHLAVSGRLVMKCYNLADERPHRADTDESVIEDLRKLFGLLYRQEDD